MDNLSGKEEGVEVEKIYYLSQKALEKLGKYEEAMAKMKELSELRPGVTPLLEFGRLANKVGDTKEAAEALREARALEPNNTLVLYELGLSEYYNDNLSEARKHCQRVVNVKKNDRNSLQLMLQIQEAQKDFEGQANTISRLLKLKPKEALLHYQKGRALEALKRTEEHEQAYTAAVDLWAARIRKRQVSGEDWLDHNKIARKALDSLYQRSNSKQLREKIDELYDIQGPKKEDKS